MLSLQNDVLCIGFEIQRQDRLSDYSLTVPKSIKCGWRYFLQACKGFVYAQALGGFAAFSIKTSCIQLCIPIQEELHHIKNLAEN